MAEDMRLWAGANANRQVARKADWSLTFKGWMRREAKRGYGNGQGRPSALQDDSESISRAAERLAQAAERGEFSFGPQPTDVLRKAKQIFACYRKDEAHDPEMYAAAVAALLSGYPQYVVD